MAERSTLGHRSIELKLDDSKRRWSGANLEEVLRDQLVGKCLSHERCRSGCLPIVQREKRRWQHPKSGKTKTFVGWFLGFMVLRLKSPQNVTR